MLFKVDRNKFCSTLAVKWVIYLSEIEYVAPGDHFDYLLFHSILHAKKNRRKQLSSLTSLGMYISKVRPSHQYGKRQQRQKVNPVMAMEIAHSPLNVDDSAL